VVTECVYYVGRLAPAGISCIKMKKMNLDEEMFHLHFADVRY
jgi:hypothetical protein